MAVPTGNNEQTLTNLPVVLPGRHGARRRDSTTRTRPSTRTPASSSSRGSTDGGATWGPVSSPRHRSRWSARYSLGRRRSERHPSTGRTGAVYAVWQDSRFSKGKRDDVLLIRSTDQGRTWSAPIKVNDTPAGAQAAFLPTVMVDANGRVGVVYYDLRDDTNPRDGSFITNEWITFSTDGGRRSGRPSESRPTSIMRRRVRGGFFLGDYQGLGVSGTTFTPFFGATRATQANGQVGSDIFATTAG